MQTNRGGSAGGQEMKGGNLEKANTEEERERESEGDAKY